MADKEWYCVERASGVHVGDHEQYEFPNKEAALALARSVAPSESGPLTIVKYTRKEIRVLTRKVTIEEADVPPVP